ncbi:unnamed protein product [Miscanthus lutarioriparius]|uniref:Retrovirus-related Pol polyprotein from transposon TNT 1-94-like beta-barrel domain-containing protein n=1 Tax=Miscanthus lutarioriparius TaxID=422564 RepID=A0A811PUV0_9POAL|nr:unnamed protein product [Miscanthus lutarioriparius]
MNTAKRWGGSGRESSIVERLKSMALDGFGGKGQKSWTAEEKRKDRKALSLIQLHLHNDILQEVLQEKTAAELWLKLESICMSKDLTNTILLSRNEPTLAEVYEALQTSEKMKGMVQSDVSSSKGEVLQVRGRPEQKTYNNNNNRDKSKNGKGRSKSRGRDKFCRDWFSSYESVQSGDVVRMGDNNPCEIVGIGSVQIKMHDGMIRTLKDMRHIPGMARNLISLRTLDIEGHFWAEAANTSCYLINRSPSIPLNKKTLIEVWFGIPADYSQLRVFGCIAYAHVDNGNLSTDVSPVGSDEEQQHVNVQVKHVDDQETEIIDNNVHGIVQHSPPVLQPQNQFIVDRRTKRNCGPRPCLIEECDMVHYTFSCAEQVENIHEPATYTEAVVSGDREKWIFGMQEEMQSLEKNDTWDVVRLPKQKKAVRCKWIFKRKEGLSLTLQCASTDEDFEYMSRVSYSSAVGSLMYAMVCSRPDLSYVLSLVSRYMANPGKEHWKVVQWIFWYLRGIINACLKFSKADKGLIGYVDSDFAVGLDKRRSLTGYVFTIGGYAVSWRATLQPVVALSTTEAEYMAVAEACKESVWLKGPQGWLSKAARARARGMESARKRT